MKQHDAKQNEMMAMQPKAESSPGSSRMRLRSRLRRNFWIVLPVLLLMGANLLAPSVQAQQMPTATEAPTKVVIPFVNRNDDGNPICEDLPRNVRFNVIFGEDDKDRPDDYDPDEDFDPADPDDKYRQSCESVEALKIRVQERWCNSDARIRGIPDEYKDVLPNGSYVKLYNLCPNSCRACADTCADSRPAFTVTTEKPDPVTGKKTNRRCTYLDKRTDATAARLCRNKEIELKRGRVQYRIKPLQEQCPRTCGKFGEGKCAAFLADEGPPTETKIQLACPEIGDPPKVISESANYDFVELQLEVFQGTDVLCTLVEMDVDLTEGESEDAFSNLKPVGRSYNGNNWEAAPGDFSSSSFQCSGSCSIRLPRTSGNRLYVLRSYDYGHTLGPDDIVARFLERTTFGPTKPEIQEFASREAWLGEQFALPSTSHREFFRKRATGYSYFTSRTGLLHTGPCEEGSQYRSFALTRNDFENYLLVQKSPLDATKLTLSVGGHVRTVVDGPMEVGDGEEMEERTTIDIDIVGTYFRIGDVRTEGKYEGEISLELPSKKGYNRNIYFGGNRGNPRVHFDSTHTSLLENLLVLSQNKYKKILTQQYSGDNGMIEITNPLQSSSCAAWDNEVVGFTNLNKFAIARTEENGDFKYWIHSPVSSLLDNGVDAPLPDGGVKAVRQTTNAGRDQEEIKDFQAKCSNAPRTFLNEDSCRLVEADACSYDEDADIRDGGKVLVCGSPGEVSNHNHQGIDAGPHGKGGFDLYNRVNQTLRDSDLEEQRLNVWAEIALHSNDQLRQRVAYALSQILVITPEDVGTKQSTENFLHYYDIFVKNAFGNYFDILKEVTYSPLMARMLTYRDGVSTGYAYIKDDYIHLADENYAREIMQLFTMGLVLQNDDGTKKLDSDGNEIASYTNLHISEYAKVFVGMSDQLTRGNIENGNKRNLVDPLRIMPDWKDKFPKLGLNSKYVGDGYPLCSELPHQHFLKKGAKYRLLGAKRNPDFTNEIISDESTGNVLNIASSTLASILCNEAGDGECNPQNIVILPNDIECDGTECEMSEPRTIEIKKGLWYEYIRPPCVNQAFYNNGKSIYRKGSGLSYKNILCANPAHRDAPTACCEPNSKGDKQIASLKEIFVGERTTFETAVDRCLRDDLNICEAVPDKGLANGIFTWLSAPCSVSAKVSPDGSVGIVHQPSAMAMAGLREGEEVYRSVARDTKSFFRADWQPTVEFSTIQTFLDDFGSNCESSGCTVDALDSNCLCEVSVEDTIAFENVLDLDTAENVLSTATIGSFVPNSATFVSSGIAGIKVSPSREALSMETIFEVTDRLGNTHYRKNIISTAKLGDGSLRMRNPVTFWSLPDVTTRDGEYEMDAALEHYFFHPNVPSFLAKVLVQRFGTSNPSPRYVKAIATAFQSGKYKNFGSNKYGCLEATIAAILLDREATNHILDADPIQGQLQGPYMRLMRAMRSLEYQNNPDHPMVRFLGDIYDKIGEEPHKLPNVFSFYEPSYVAPGPAQAANLAAPEAGVLTGQSSISMVKGLMSLMRYGGSNKGDSFFFGGGKKDGTIEFGKNTYNPAKYGLDPESADDVVDDLAMLLTSGRLSLDNRRIIKETFQESISNSMADNPIEEALVSAQQLITLSPEFHSNSVVRKGTKNRETTDDKEAAGVPYKAVIQVMLNGGLDSFSVLVPDSCTGTNAEGTTVDQQYRDVRGPLAFDRSKGEYDLTITPNSEQPCESFAIHEDLPFVKELYDDGDLLFFANVGVVNNNKMNRENWEDKTRARLFSHSSMQQEAIKLDTYEKLPGSGVLGRLNDMLINKFNGTANSIGISDNSNTLRGYETEGAPILVVGKNGPIQFKTGRRDEEPLFDIEEAALKINSEQDVFSSIFAETWSDTFVTGIFDGERLSEFIANNIEGLDSEIWASEPDEDNKTKLKFQTLAEMIQTREDRGVDRDTFSINMGGFDHHAQLKASLKEKLPALNLNLRRLKEQLVKEGLWEHVTIVVQSEFGRTISFNSNDGADHGWGGNYMVLGGGLRGGRVLGKYPDDFTPTSRLNASKNSRVRFMPTTSWEHVFNGISEWYVEGFDKEVTQEDLDYVIPNRKSVVDPVESEGSHPLYTASDMYNVKAKKNNIFVRQRSS